MDRTTALAVVFRRARREFGQGPGRGAPTAALAGVHPVGASNLGAAPGVPDDEAAVLEAARTLGTEPANRRLDFLRLMALSSLEPIKNDPDLVQAWRALRPNAPALTDARPVLDNTPPGTYDRVTGLFTVTIKVSSTKPVSYLKTALDPQGWDHESPFFDKSYVMPSGDIDKKIPPQPLSSPQTRGTSWSGYLYEKVQFQGYEFHNVLDISCKTPGNSYEFTYDMYRCAWSIVPGLPAGPGGLRRNLGYLKAVPDGGGSMITASKSFRFADRPAPYTAFALGSQLRDGLSAGWAESLSIVAN